MGMAQAAAQLRKLLKPRCILASVVLAALAASCAVRPAAAPATVRAIDPAFVPGLAKLKRAAGFIEDHPNQSPSDWKPNLQLLVGVKAVEASKSTVAFVQLTTLPLTNSTGQRSPSLRTNHWA